MSSSYSRTIHTRRQAFIFRIKVFFLQIKRAIENISNAGLQSHKFSNALKKAPVIAESKSPLWTYGSTEEQFLIAGKIHNLRIAANRLNGLELTAGEVFSFWQAIGKATRAKGYVVGRELREGCIIPSVGGGLCQVSNALYDAALKANFDIVERHAHSKVIKGSLAEIGRDATVFWNHIDLRFYAQHAFRIEAFLTKDHFYVRLRSNEGLSKDIYSTAITEPKAKAADKVNSCASCGVDACFRSLKIDPEQVFGNTAFLLDAYTPEFDAYIQKTKSAKDKLLIPLNGKYFRKAGYAWNTEGVAKTMQSFWVTLERSYRSRNLAEQGEARQKNLLAMSEKLAASYEEKLAYDDLHLVVQQSLLPFLWQRGALGGRRYDVLMDSLPMSEIQLRLDSALALHPNSRTLSDFRVDNQLLQAESDALQAADKIITSHTAIATLFADKVELLDWQFPGVSSVSHRDDKFTILFPASTVGRKGCYELREAIRDLDVRLLLLGKNIEGTDFWDGIETQQAPSNWPEKVDLVVLPAFVEHQPRPLLRAVASGIPVIASESCGVKGLKGVTELVDDADLSQAVRREIQKHL